MFSFIPCCIYSLLLTSYNWEHTSRLLALLTAFFLVINRAGFEERIFSFWEKGLSGQWESAMKNTGESGASGRVGVPWARRGKGIQSREKNPCIKNIHQIFGHLCRVGFITLHEREPFK